MDPGSQNQGRQLTFIPDNIPETGIITLYSTDSQTAEDNEDNVSHRNPRYEH